ncbi:MAG: bifunctional (p)ppGpp synthetase/guanosine-3',5'-bis(diphosphate) 3'-pyrophosphohydrolase [Bacteroidota bacterium]
MQNIDFEAEKNEILNRYKNLLKVLKPRTSKEDKLLIRKAFDLAVEAHKDMRRKTGEPYIYHPIEVAHIAAFEIGLGTTSVVCALLHDVVEDTDYTIQDMEGLFGPKVAKIIDGLTKMSGVFDSTSSLQAENFRKMLLTLSDDVRVILIKLADRLHNMRTLDAMKHEKQLKIASETQYLYAPLAHRLGLYAIKTELEDLCMKYIEPQIFENLSQKLIDTQAERNKYITRFVEPINDALKQQDVQFEIYGRVKSIYSIWQKMKNKNVPFEEVFDLFAIRIVIDTPLETEKSNCWKVYSTVTDFYRPNPDRLRDWISTPKANGYESLHTTLMGPDGKWVEVQIRSTRMDDIAEKGYAAHWKYKEAAAGQNALDEWLKKIRELLESPESNALDFIDNFKLNLFSDEIFVFTPKGELKSLPIDSSPLDYAYSIHSKIGNTAIGAKVNLKLVPLSYKLKSGDQVEIITSDKQQPQDEWVDWVQTARAKSKIKEAIRINRKNIIENGKDLLDRRMREINTEYTPQNIDKLVSHFNLTGKSDLFFRIAKDDITFRQVRDFFRSENSGRWYKYIQRKLHLQDIAAQAMSPIDKIIQKVSTKPSELIIDKDIDSINYTISSCCNPIPGDSVFGFMTESEGIKIHRTNCPVAIQLMSKYGSKIVKAKWTSQERISFLTGLKMTGVDDMGLLNRITRIISKGYGINMRSLNFEGHEGMFEGIIMVYVQDTNQLNELIDNLKKVKGVISIVRIDRT